MDILIYIIGGIFAGIATGLVGLSAAVIIAPLFATMLGIDPYVAIGIALASDVFASAISSATYIRNHNYKIKKVLIFGIVIIVFTILGSVLSYEMNRYNLKSSINIFVFLLGIRFIVYPVKNRSQGKLLISNRFILVQSIIWGIVIGMISGYFGSGGGLSILAVLTMLFGYKLKEAVGTSVIIMTFTALVGAAVHIYMDGTLWIPLVITSIAALIGANVASVIANKIDEITLNRVIGAFLLLFGIALILVHYIE